MIPITSVWGTDGFYYTALTPELLVRFPLKQGFHGNTECNHSFLALACFVANEYSHDPSTQVGSILVPNVSNHMSQFGKYRPTEFVFAANRIPADMISDPMYIQAEKLKDREYKLQVVEHAERACIFSAAQHLIPTKDSIMYATWFSCTSCTRAIIASGVRKIFGLAFCREKQPDRWKQEIEASMSFYETSSMTTEFVSTDEFLSKQHLEIMRFQSPLYISQITTLFHKFDQLKEFDWQRYLPTITIDGKHYNIG